MGKVLIVLSGIGGIDIKAVVETANKIYKILSIDGTDFEVQIKSAEDGAILDADEEAKIVAEWTAAHPVVTK